MARRPARRQTPPDRRCHGARLHRRQPNHCATTRSGRFTDWYRQQIKPRRAARAVHGPLPARFAMRRRRPGRPRGMEHPPRAVRAAHHDVSRLPRPRRGRGESAGAAIRSTCASPTPTSRGRSTPRPSSRSASRACRSRRKARPRRRSSSRSTAATWPTTSGSPQEYMPGVSVSGRAAPWIYRAGVYSSGAMNREFGDFNGEHVHARPASATTSRRSSA